MTGMYCTGVLTVQYWCVMRGARIRGRPPDHVNQPAVRRGAHTARDAIYLQVH